MAPNNLNAHMPQTLRVCDRRVCPELRRAENDRAKIYALAPCRQHAKSPLSGWTRKCLLASSHQRKQRSETGSMAHTSGGTRCVLYPVPKEILALEGGRRGATIRQKRKRCHETGGKRIAAGDQTELTRRQS